MTPATFMSDAAAAIWANLKRNVAASGDEAKRLVMISEADVRAAVADALPELRAAFAGEWKHRDLWSEVAEELTTYPGVDPKCVEAFRKVREMIAEERPSEFTVDGSDGSIDVRWLSQGQPMNLCIAMISAERIVIVATDLRKSPLPTPPSEPSNG